MHTLVIRVAHCQCYNQDVVVPDIFWFLVQGETKNFQTYLQTETFDFGSETETQEQNLYVHLTY